MPETLPITLFTPVPPMRAASVSSVREAMEQVAPGRPVSIEVLPDGVRIQAHKRGDEVRVFDASGTDVTDAMPAVVSAITSADAEALVVEGFAVGENATPAFTDALLLDAPLLTRPLSERTSALAELMPVAQMNQATITDQPVIADAFASHVRAQGHPAVVVKSLDSRYQPGTTDAWAEVVFR
ncbi:MAG: hypothetical protein QM708_06960 [Propioniciclava sp.]|uniref:ATP-dependent DNA ligase n=1 Tax=Propioniciclava sp. TaxID=2038686 RepID=UPI0039E6239E